MAKVINIRFYEELNDFLPRNLRKKRFRHEFTGRPSVKDIIEAIGVPHAEVDLVLVNGESVNFQHHPIDGDDVSVYPVFESLDITSLSKLRPAPLREIKFITDVHLGKLASYLRLCGFDTLYNIELDDHEIVQISVKENRIVLTRDIGLLKHKQLTHGFWIRSQNSREQLQQVVKRLHLHSKISPFTRCMKCNGILETVDKADVLPRLKPKTRKFYDEFYRCTNCGSIYWKGSHYEKMSEWLREIEKYK